MMFSKLILLIVFSVNASLTSKCLNTADYVKKNVKTEEYLGDWQMVHVRPIYSQGFVCPTPHLKVTTVSNKDIAHWKNHCLHKLDISILDETKFELKVTFPDGFEVPFTIIKRQKSEDHIFFPSCKFEKIEFYKNGDIKMWIATREEDNVKIPIAVSVPPWEETRCVLNDNDDLYYFFC